MPLSVSTGALLGGQISHYPSVGFLLSTDGRQCKLHCSLFLILDSIIFDPRFDFAGSQIIHNDV